MGVLLVNLGTPGEPTAKGIRRYLGEFLSDPRVIEMPPWLWQPILRGAILPFRPRKLVPRYRHIWLENGSPLLVYSRAQAVGLQAVLQARGVDARVALGMRYGEPSLASALDGLREQGCERILVVPMYPQYAASTTATAVDRVAKHVASYRDQPELRFVKRYPADGAYIDALVQRAETHWREHGKPERLLLSFHGLPQRCVDLGDPYYDDCARTLRALAGKLESTGVPCYMAFQSRFGAQKWLEPYTEPTLKQWAAQGVKSVDLMCPGFLADCLETLEEIDIEGRRAFLDAGGQQFRYIPCLNDSQGWIDGFASIVQRHLSGWVSHPSASAPGEPSFD